MSGIPIWIPLVVAVLSATPAYYALYRQRRGDRDASTATNRKTVRLERDLAIQGFEQLLEELRTELDRRTRMFDLDLKHAEAACEKRIVEAIADMKHNFNGLVNAHNRLDAEFNGGVNQVEELR